MSSRTNFSGYKLKVLLVATGVVVVLIGTTLLFSTSSSSASSSFSTHSTSFKSLASPPKKCSKVLQQCGGLHWKGATCCQGTAFCSQKDDYYSQCLPAGKTPYPLVHYSFNEKAQIVNTGVVKNLGPSMYNGVTSGGVTVVPGHPGTAVQFNDVDGVVTVNNSENMGVLLENGFTLSAYIKRYAVTSEDGIIGKNYGTDQIRFTFYNDQLNFIVFPANCAGLTLTYTPPNDNYLNTWVYTQASYQTGPAGSTLKIIFHGVTTTQFFPGCSGIQSGDIAVHVGNTNNGGTPWADFDGAIDEVKIFAKAL